LHNEQGRGFRCVDEVTGIPVLARESIDTTFTANFVDVNHDEHVDLLVAADFGTSAVLLRTEAGGFERWASPVISDENGMGSAIGDYDADGQLDWFVTGIRDADGVTEGDWGTSGNRLYRGLADGTFEDVTDRAGVRDGDWGWAACFADLNLDGLLDLVHVSGWPQGAAQFRDTNARLFLGAQDGRFTEASGALGLVEHAGGRGLSCFDADRDGDIDLFVMNHDAPARLWENVGGSEAGSWLRVRLEGAPPNTQAVGATIRVVAGGTELVRVIRAGSNYVSQDPAEAHFGLGAATRVERVEVRWPNGAVTTSSAVDVNRALVVAERPDEPRKTSGERSGGCSLAVGFLH
jgi:hypothetical protein